MIPDRASQGRERALEERLYRYLEDSLPASAAIRAFACVDSTMDVAQQLAAAGMPEGTLVWAERQMRGRGRQGRAWLSPEGGVYLSFILSPVSCRRRMPQLSLIVGLAAAEAIQQLTQFSPTIRWPNDILIDGRKVAGILVEATSSAVIAGLGINVTTRPDELPETAACLAAGGVSACDRFELTARFYSRFQVWYALWRREGLKPISGAIRSRMAMFGQVVHIKVGSRRIEGTASDLDESGRLLIRLDSGIVRALDMGEVSLLT